MANTLYMATTIVLFLSCMQQFLSVCLDLCAQGPIMLCVVKKIVGI